MLALLSTHLFFLLVQAVFLPLVSNTLCPLSQSILFSRFLFSWEPLSDLSLIPLSQSSLCSTWLCPGEPWSCDKWVGLRILLGDCWCGSPAGFFPPDLLEWLRWVGESPRVFRQDLGLRGCLVQGVAGHSISVLSVQSMSVFQGATVVTGWVGIRRSGGRLFV